jgi:type IV pilus assembly protein PilN
MYSLDINLLRERPEYRQGGQTQFATTSLSGGTQVKGNNIPLYIGGGVFLLTLLGVGGGWLWLGQQTTQLEAKTQQLEQQLGSLKSQEQRLSQINTEVAQVTGENQSFATVFNQVQPWSAILQDLRENIPQGVQVSSIIQTDTKQTTTPAAKGAPPKPGGGLAAKITTPPNPEAQLTPAKPGASPAPSPGAKPGASPSPGTLPLVANAAGAMGALPPEIATAKLEVIGTAKSFDEVNNFLLTLKRSSFFSPEETYLVSTSLVKSSIALDKPKIEGGKSQEEKLQQNEIAEKLKRLELPKVVEYKIQTAVKRIPAAELIGELERKGAVGLVTRLKTLQKQQVLKP